MPHAAIAVPGTPRTKRRAIRLAYDKPLPRANYFEIFNVHAVDYTISMFIAQIACVRYHETDAGTVPVYSSRRVGSLVGPLADIRADTGARDEGLPDGGI